MPASAADIPARRAPRPPRSIGATAGCFRARLVAAASFIVGLCGIGPLVIVLVYSFLQPGDYGGVKWIFSTEPGSACSVQRDIFDDTLHLADAHLTIFWRSVLLSLATTAIICLIFGFPPPVSSPPGPSAAASFWLFLITIPFWTNLLIRTFAIMEMIRNEGVINSLRRLGLIEQPIQIMYTDFAVLVGMAYVYLPLMVLPLYASIEKLDFRLVEAGYDLYATRCQVLRRVILPLVKPGIVAGSILVFIPSLGAYVTPRILGGGKNMMIGNLIELQFGQGRNWPLGSALALL